MNRETFQCVAEQLLSRGLNIIPLCKWDYQGVGEKSRGKAPRIKSWEEYKSRTATLQEVAAWSELDTDLNIGVVCGVTSNITVIDADSAEAVALLEEEYKLPNTLKAKTRNGYHYYYQYCPNPSVNNAVNALPNVDIRTQGGYVVAPQSTHRTGFTYEWVDASTPIAPFPKCIEDILTKRSEEANANRGITGVDFNKMVDGSGRDALLTQIGGSLHHLGLSPDLLLSNLTAINASFGEPLPDRDVQKIARSVGRYTTDAPLRRLTEIGVAERFVDTYHDSLCYNPSTGSWLIYDGRRWATQPTENRICPLVMDKIIALVRSIPDEVPKDSENRPAYEKFARSCESAGKVNAIAGLCASKLTIASSQFDRDPFLLNCRNRTLQLDKHVVREHASSDMCSKLLQVDYDPAATCPMWESFIARIFNNNQPLIDYIQRALGYTLTGDTSEHAFFTLYGCGANGKSVFLDTILNIMADYGQQATFSTFLAKSGDGGIRNDIANMAGARFVSAAESGVFKTIDDALIKDITGGKQVTARFLHKEFFQYTPQMKIWLATNHKPNIHDDSNGMWRRVRLIPFLVTIPAEEQDHRLYYKLMDEYSGILNWFLKGFKAWQANGLGTCPLIEQATSEYKESMDTVGRFLYDTLRQDGELSIKSSTLYEAFSSWCRSNGETVWKHSTFSMKFADRGYVKQRRKDGIYWLGVDLNTQF